MAKRSTRKARDFELVTLSRATRQKLDVLVSAAHPGDDPRANYGPRVYLEELIEIAIAERFADAFGTEPKDFRSVVFADVLQYT